MFNTRLSFCSHGAGVYPSMQWGRHPLGRHPPQGKHPLLGKPPPQILRDTVNKRAVMHTCLTFEHSFQPNPTGMHTCLIFEHSFQPKR